MNLARFFKIFCLLPEREINGSVSVSFENTIDMSRIEYLRNSVSKDIRPSYSSFVVKALAQALEKFPYANQRVYRIPFMAILGPQKQSFNNCDIAVAIERSEPNLESFAFVNVIKDANRLSLKEINHQLRTFSNSTEETSRQLRNLIKVISRLPLWLAIFVLTLPAKVPSMWSKYRGAAALVSSPAKYGVDSVYGVWAWPLGVSFGLVKERPLVVNGELTVRSTMSITMTFDRRIMAGAQAAQFFNFLCEKLQSLNLESVEDVAS